MSTSPPNSADESVSTAVVEAVAAQMDVLPTELPEKLHDVIDPDSLNSLFTSGNSTDGTVTFTYCGYTVTVTADGDVTLEE